MSFPGSQKARIRNTGHPCIRYDGYRFTCREQIHDMGDLLMLIMLVKREEGFVNTVLLQQDRRGPCILACDIADTFESFCSPQSEIGEVADGSGNDIDRKSTRVNSSHLAISYA